MIFSSIPMNNLCFETAFTSFDHLFVNATFGQVHPRVEPTMKDHILGSDEYLIRAQDTILQHLERFSNKLLAKDKAAQMQISTSTKPE
jgi:hypothetical protein